jgi:hypothetical protein
VHCPPCTQLPGQSIVPVHAPAPVHDVVHPQDWSQLIPPMQLPSPVHWTSHALVAQRTPPAHAPLPPQRTWHGRFVGHTTGSGHAPGSSQLMMQIPFVHDVQTIGQSELASISAGSSTHHPSMQSRPAPHCPGFVQRKSSERESMLHAGPSATASATATSATTIAVSDALTSVPPARHRHRRG